LIVSTGPSTRTRASKRVFLWVHEKHFSVQKVSTFHPQASYWS